VTRQDYSQEATEWMQGVLASDEDLLAKILELGLQALMEAERDVHVGARPFERTGVRRTQRNGYKPRRPVDPVRPDRSSLIVDSDVADR